MQCSEEGSPIAKKPPTIDLQYPTIPVYGTPSSWLSQSQLVTMASNPDDSSMDDTSSSLGDSTYEFVDDKSTVASDDEDQDSSNEDRETELQVDHQPQHHSNDERRSQPSRSRSSSLSFDHDDALMTESQSTSNQASPRNEHKIIEANEDILEGKERNRQKMIQLDEPKNSTICAIKETEGSYTLKYFQGHEVSEMLHHFRMVKPPAQITATVRQTMISQRFGLSGPYKVLYVGDVSAKESIIRKLGSALAVSLGSEVFQRSRFNVVPISSFGDVASPEVVLIDSTGLEINVEECMSASFTKMDGGNDTVSMNLSNQKTVDSSWSGTEHVVTDDWNLPDLAVFYLTENDNISAKQTRHFARKFMGRHKIPCIVISQCLLWTKPVEVIALDQKTPHICLEIHSSESDEFRIIKRRPIDQATFLELDAVQMNRNLALLATTRHSSRAPWAQGRSESNCEPQRASKPTNKNRTHFTGFSCIDESHIIERLPHVEKVLTSGLFLILGLLLYHFAVNSFFAIGTPQVINSHENPAIAGTILNFLPTKLMTATSVSSRTAPTPISKPASSLMNQLYAPKAKPVSNTNTDIASFLLDRDALLPNKSDGFYVKIIGDCHIIIKTPQWFSRYKRAPKIKSTVIRGDKTLNHKLSMLFDGVYALEIPLEDAYGTLNVSVGTVSKLGPGIKESFELHFGSSWFKALGCKKIARGVTSSIRSDLNFVQTGLINTYNHTCTEIRSLAVGAWQTVKGARKGANKISGVSRNKTTKTTDIVLAQTLDLSRNISRQLGRRSLAASKHVMIYAEDMCKDLIAYSSNTSIAFSRQARKLSQVASSNIESSVKGFIDSRKKHLRETQKKTLKAWWKVSGLPKRQLSTDMPCGKPRKSVKPTKKVSR